MAARRTDDLTEWESQQGIRYPCPWCRRALTLDPAALCFDCEETADELHREADAASGLEAVS